MPTSSSSYHDSSRLVVLVYSLVLTMTVRWSEGQLVPATFVFGDSVVDVGNNNYLPFTIAKANYPHYGVDFPSQKATGRFSNGYNPSDFLAQKMGLPAPPPYLSISSNDGNRSFPLTGLNFASSGSGIFNETGNQYGQHIPLAEQVDDYSNVYSTLIASMGDTAAKKMVGKSLFFIEIASNDMLNYYRKSDLRKKFTPEERFNQMASTLKSQMERLYAYGARRFIVPGLLAIGCAPVFRVETENEECDEEMNSFCVSYNRILKSMLAEFKSDHNDSNYTYFDTSVFFMDLLHNASNYGFTETKAACCGVGTLKADFFCLPVSTYCKERSSYMFWDRIHPTQAMYRLLVDSIVDGPSKYVTPMNVRQLVSA
ncbi:GDSL esterase/lipase At5g55050 [Linum grandiflorum]